MPRMTDELPPSSGLHESGKRPPELDPLGPYFRQKRDPAAADKVRREKFANRTATPVAELTRPQIVANLAHNWAVPVALVQRLLDAESEIYLLKADLSSVYDRLNKLEAK